MSGTQQRIRWLVVVSGLLGLGSCSSNEERDRKQSASLDVCRTVLGATSKNGECEDERRCSAIRSAPTNAYSYLIRLRAAMGASSGLVTKDVYNCAATVMEAMGATVTRGEDSSLLRIRGTYSQVQEAFSWAVTKSWLPVCASDSECAQCTGYTPAACLADPFCSTIYGSPIVDGEKGARTPISCAVRECDPIETMALDPNGACWNVACVPPGWTLDTTSKCQEK